MSDFLFKKWSSGLAAGTVLLCSSSFGTTPALTVSQEKAWQFDAVPYIWFLNMNGRVGVRDKTAHVNQDFSDILQKLNFAAMLWLDAHKGNWEIFLNSLYADLSDSASQGPYSVDATNHFGLFGGGVGYKAYRHCFTDACHVSTHVLEVSPYAGFRYTLNNTSVTFDAGHLSLTRSDNQHWTDPIIGAKMQYHFTPSWLLTLAGDIGGTNRSSDYSYNANGLLGFTPQSFWKNTTTYLGYRILYQHYSTGNGNTRYVWNMKIFGPMVGFGISF